MVAGAPCELDLIHSKHDGTCVATYSSPVEQVGEQVSELRPSQKTCQFINLLGFLQKERLQGKSKGKYDKGSLKGNTDKGSLKGNNDKGGDDWEQELYRFRAVEFERKLKGKGKDDDDRWLAPWTQQAQQQEVRR